MQDDNSRRAFIAGAAATMTLPAQAQNIADERPKAGDYFVGADDDKKTPLRAENIKAEEPPLFAWAVDPQSKTLRDGSRLNKVLFVRIDPAKAVDATKERQADGIVAYSAICTHTGCDVVNYAANVGLLVCPCHESQYDPLDGARVVDGPSPRPLPALPIKIVDGVIICAGPFATRPGFTPG